MFQVLLTFRDKRQTLNFKYQNRFKQLYALLLLLYRCYLHQYSFTFIFWDYLLFGDPAILHPSRSVSFGLCWYEICVRRVFIPDAFRLQTTRLKSRL